MSKLLRFLVNHRLSESTQPLKGYTIAVDALGRTDNFDAQIDSYPRVQMGRLRRIIEHFYLRNGGENRLVIPYNHYEILLVPNIAVNVEPAEQGAANTVDKAPSEPVSTGAAIAMKVGTKVLAFTTRQLAFAVATAIILSVAASFYLMRDAKARTIAYPEIIVVEPKGISNASARGQAEVIRGYLVGALEKFDTVRVYDELADGAGGPAYLLESSILDATGSRIQIRLIDSSTGEVIWSDRVEMTDPEKLDDDLGKDVIAIAGPYGAIARNELARYGGDHAVGYPCLLQFHQYLRYRQQDALKPALACIDKSGKRFPEDAYMLSMLATAKDISARVDSPYRIEGSSKEMAQRAMKLNDHSAAAAFAIAQSAFIEGNCREGVAWGKRAVELNPLNSRITGYLGVYMLACRLPEGEEYAARAMEMDPNTDRVFAAMVAFQKFRRGDARGARAFSLQYMATAEKEEPGLELTYILSTAALGDRREARRAWKHLTARYGLPQSATPRQMLGRWIANPAVVREIELEFEKVQL